MILKGGIIVQAQMGDANASIPTPQPSFSRPMFGALGRAVGPAALVFVSQASVAKVQADYGLRKHVVAVRGCRSVGKKDMALNDYLPNIEVDPETYRMTVAGAHLTCAPAEKLPLAQLYNLF